MSTSQQDVEDYSPVDVHVKSLPLVPRDCLRSTLKTWVLDATGALGPTATQIVGDDDPDRDHLFIYSLDQSVIVSTEFQNAAVTTVAGGQPTGQSIVVASGAANGIKIYGNLDIWLCSITGQTITRVCVITNRRVREY
jgi:hypothetical protein